MASFEPLFQYIKPDTLHTNIYSPSKLLILIFNLSQHKQNNSQHIHLHHIQSHHIHSQHIHPNRSQYN